MKLTKTTSGSSLRCKTRLQPSPKAMQTRHHRPVREFIITGEKSWSHWQPPIPAASPLPGGDHTDPRDLGSSSGLGSAFNRDSALPGVLHQARSLQPAAAASGRAKRRLQPARFGRGAAARAASRRINPRSPAFPGLPCLCPRQRWQHVPSQGSQLARARAARRPRMFSISGRSLGHPIFHCLSTHSLGLQGFCQSLDPLLLPESWKDENKRKRKRELNKNRNKKSRHCAGWLQTLLNRDRKKPRGSGSSS